MVQTTYGRPSAGQTVLARDLRIGDRTIYNHTVKDVILIEGGDVVLVKHGEAESSWFRSDEEVQLLTRGPE